MYRLYLVFKLRVFIAILQLKRLFVREAYFSLGLRNRNDSCASIITNAHNDSHEKSVLFHTKNEATRYLFRSERHPGIDFRL